MRRFSVYTQLLNQLLRADSQLIESLEQLRAALKLSWRFTKNNGITEGFHNKMETLSRQAYGFRNFENYRLRVRVMCA